MNTTPDFSPEKKTPDFFLEHVFLFVHKGALFLPISVLGSVPTLSNPTAESKNPSKWDRLGILSHLVKPLFSVFEVFHIIVPRGPDLILLRHMWVWFQIFSEFTGRAWKYQRRKRQKPTSGMERFQVDAIYTMCNIFGVFFFEISLFIYHCKSKMLSSILIFTNCTTSFKMNIWAIVGFFTLCRW